MPEYDPWACDGAALRDGMAKVALHEPQREPRGSTGSASSGAPWAAMGVAPWALKDTRAASGSSARYHAQEGSTNPEGSTSASTDRSASGDYLAVVHTLAGSRTGA